MLPFGITMPLHAQTQWQTIDKGSQDNANPTLWKIVPTEDFVKKDLVWEPLSAEEEQLKPDELVWTEPESDVKPLADIESDLVHEESREVKPDSDSGEPAEEGFRWPNGQLMSEADQIYYRSAWSRGSMVQIGDTVYPNIGMNSLQRAPGSWVEFGLTAIDDSWQWFGPGNKPDGCNQANFASRCADGLMQNNIRVWRSPAFSAELNWTIHSLSGEGSPFNFTIGDTNFGDSDSGTKFGEGQSLGFRLAKNFGKTFGVSVGGDRLWHLDETTDLSKPLYIRGTKIFRLNDTLEPPIVSVTFGLMTDVYNPDTMLGSVEYPDWLLGGEYPSLFAEQYDGQNKRNTNGRGYYPNVAGTSSAFVCAEDTIFNGKQPTDDDKDCIKKVAIAPVGSIGFAPWPWLGFYANFTRNLNLGISVKPFKEFNWNISAHLVSPIVGLNSSQDRSIERNRCPDDHSFSSCRTRIGLWTEVSF